MAKVASTTEALLRACCVRFRLRVLIDSVIYSVRWRLSKDELEHKSDNHLSTTEATDFACAVLNQTTVCEISVVDGSGHQVMRMPEIIRYWRLKKA